MNPGFHVLVEAASSLPFLKNCDSGRRRDLKASHLIHYKYVSMVQGLYRRTDMKAVQETILRRKYSCA